MVLKFKFYFFYYNLFFKNYMMESEFVIEFVLNDKGVEIVFIDNWDYCFMEKLFFVFVWEICYLCKYFC